jgi:feruloyl esterase
MKNAAFVFVTIVLLASVPQASAQQRSACDALIALSQPNTSITLARSIGSSADLDVPSSDRPRRGPVGDLPPFCRVAATLKPSADSDIKIEVWLPLENWNGRFQAVGNGGFAGSIEYAAMANA